MAVTLSKPISIYLEAENGGDFDILLPECFTEEATVLDEGRLWEGLADIRTWMTETRERFRHRVEPIALTSKGDKIVITGKVSGSFPYSPVNLDFIFEIRDDKIISLEWPLPADRLLAPLQGQKPPAPAWFEAAVAQEPERMFVPVRGVDIETLSWGKRGAPGLLLLHDMAANADWWSFIAPFLADRFRVTALSWSGMGWSGWRDAYDQRAYADEIWAVIAACGLCESSTRPLVAAHGFGALPLLHTALDHEGRLGGIVLIDSDIRPADPSAAEVPPPRPHALRPYWTLEKALIPFKLQPPQACENLFLVDHIARQSVKQVAADGAYPAGWTWRADPALQFKARGITSPHHMADLSVPVAMVVGDRSHVVVPALRQSMRAMLPAVTMLITVPDSDHHIMLDQPLALVSALNALLAVWPQ